MLTFDDVNNNLLSPSINLNFIVEHCLRPWHSVKKSCCGINMKHQARQRLSFSYSAAALLLIPLYLLFSGPHVNKAPGPRSLFDLNPLGMCA
jgi:hypothetical protein